MSRIRTVKPDLFKHDDLYDAEIETGLPVRIAFIALFTCCDREGRFKWKPRRIKIDTLPYDDVCFESVLDALHKYEFVEKYEFEGKFYGRIPTWGIHQSINHKEQESFLPSPEVSTIIKFGEDESENEGKNKNTIENNIVTAGKERVNHASTTREPRVNHASGTREVRVNHALTTRAGGKGREGKGKEGKGKEEHIVDFANRPSAIQSDVDQIFEHWKTTMNHPSAKLDDKRKSVIKKMLKSGYSVEQLRNAITGCSYTAHNMGDNDRAQRYDGLNVILKSADQVDRFINNFSNPPEVKNKGGTRSANNLSTLTHWVQKKKAERGLQDV